MVIQLHCARFVILLILLLTLSHSCIVIFLQAVAASAIQQLALEQAQILKLFSVLGISSLTLVRESR